MTGCVPQPNPTTIPTWSDRSKTTSALIGARDAAALLRAIERARTGTAGPARVRVEAEEDEAAEVEGLAEEGAKKSRR